MGRPGEESHQDGLQMDCSWAKMTTDLDVQLTIPKLVYHMDSFKFASRTWKSGSSWVLHCLRPWEHAHAHPLPPSEEPPTETFKLSFFLLNSEEPPTETFKLIKVFFVLNIFNPPFSRPPAASLFVAGLQSGESRDEGRAREPSKTFFQGDFLRQRSSKGALKNFLSRC